MNIPTAPNVPKMPAAPNMKMPAAPNMKVPTAPSGPAFSRRANGFQQLPTHDPDDYLDNGNDHEGKDRCCIPSRRSRGGVPARLLLVSTPVDRRWRCGRNLQPAGQNRE